MDTIVVIRGLWMSPSRWNSFRRFYEERGCQVLAPAWPRMSASLGDMRRNPSPLPGLGLREIVDHYEDAVRSLDSGPVFMGHSMGGLIFQILLDRGFEPFVHRARALRQTGRNRKCYRLHRKSRRQLHYEREPSRGWWLYSLITEIQQP